MRDYKGKPKPCKSRKNKPKVFEAMVKIEISFQIGKVKIKFTIKF